MTGQKSKIEDLITDLMYLRKGHGFIDSRVYQASTFMFSFQEILEAPESETEEDFAGQSFETPTLTYKQKVIFKGGKPHILWSYDKLSRIERPGEPTNENRLKINEDGSVKKEFTQLYCGLHSGIAWRWK